MVADTQPMVSVTKRDVVWNYVGTIASMGSNFILLPMLIFFLTDEQLGLWYVFVAISGFAQLLELGFATTLSRNILYCFSGARRLTKQGCDYSSVEAGIDWHLFRVVLQTSKRIYAVVGVVGFSLAATVGSLYVGFVTDSFAVQGSLPSWILFSISVFSNLYFLYCLTYLRGIGDVAGENKAKTFARIVQLVVTAILLLAGGSLLAASFGFLIYSIIMPVIAIVLFKSHGDIQTGVKSDAIAITRFEINEVLRTTSYIAWRDGVVSFAWYGATQATSLLCSAFLGLSETATYATMLQFASAVSNLACVYLRSCLPMFQSAYVRGEVELERRVVERGMACYTVVSIVGTLIVVMLLLPLLSLIKSDFVCDRLLYLGLSVYYFLLTQHSMFCNIIVSMNEIPYFKSYIVSTIAGIFLSGVLCGLFSYGAWGLVVGQAFPQLIYNNWKWPKTVLDSVGLSYGGALGEGMKWWVQRFWGARRK